MLRGRLLEAPSKAPHSPNLYNRLCVFTEVSHCLLNGWGQACRRDHSLGAPRAPIEGMTLISQLEPLQRVESSCCQKLFRA
eukprot:1002637-Pyramimonas_sp.AAC.1